MLMQRGVFHAGTPLSLYLVLCGLLDHSLAAIDNVNALLQTIGRQGILTHEAAGDVVDGVALLRSGGVDAVGRLHSHYAVGLDIASLGGDGSCTGCYGADDLAAYGRDLAA